MTEETDVRTAALNAIIEWCADGTIKTFDDVIFFVYGYAPDCRLSDAIDVVHELRERGLIGWD